MKNSEKRLFIFVLSSVLSVLIPLTFGQPLVTAEEYPARAISVIAPAAPGGAIDLSARAFATVAEKYLGKPWSSSISRAGRVCLPRWTW